MREGTLDTVRVCLPWIKINNRSEPEEPTQSQNELDDNSIDDHEEGEEKKKV